MLSARVPDWPQCQPVFWENDAEQSLGIHKLCRSRVCALDRLSYPSPATLIYSCWLRLITAWLGTNWYGFSLVLLDKVNYSLTSLIAGSTAVTMGFVVQVY